eukprot:5715306-Pyramimonas_sp.AAC.1
MSGKPARLFSIAIPTPIGDARLAAPRVLRRKRGLSVGNSSAYAMAIKYAVVIHDAVRLVTSR